MNNDLRHGFSWFSQRFSKSLRIGSNGSLFSDISRFTLTSVHISFSSPRGGHMDDLTDNSLKDSQLLEKIHDAKFHRDPLRVT